MCNRAHYKISLIDVIASMCFSRYIKRIYLLFPFNADDAVIPTEEPFGEIKDGRKVKRWVKIKH